MKQKNFNFIGEEHVYVAPSLSILDVHSEGVLCQSGLTIDDWTEDDELLDFN